MLVKLADTMWKTSWRVSWSKMARSCRGSTSIQSVDGERKQPVRNSTWPKSVKKHTPSYEDSTLLMGMSAVLSRPQRKLCQHRVVRLAIERRSLFYKLGISKLG
ncbi:hypothetical protein PsorP6_017893 [Peronosclerospora sorghi]|uniref:Uncharacterized protein n=1 Tax=Peronosclerospora sorghi TaxID=230839 RepID=A0ACC0WEW5_9STRA|nr:hypothetical protein PsorP6_017893 [Peronosclerospora sorghi]